MSLVRICWACVPLLLGANAAFCVEHLAHLDRNFRHPPGSARPWVFWFWLNGNITSNGITADLEAMRRVGIGGVAIMDVDQGTPKGPITFLSPEWIHLFQHTCAEAHRLGLQVNINNDAGWAGSGGPWITPDRSMQKLVWSETRVAGPTNFEAVLQPPETIRNFYRDVALLAFPAAETEPPSMRESSPKISASLMTAEFDPAKLMDGDFTSGIGLPRPDPGKPQFVQVQFPQPFRARRLALNMPGLTSHKMCRALLQTSADGQTFQTVREFDAEAASLSINFPETTASWFRVKFTSAEPYLESLKLAELDLSPQSRLDNYMEKALFVPQKEYPDKTNYAFLPPETHIPRTRLIDLSSKLQPDGRLRWEVPPGGWTLLRFGHTSTGEDNQPAPDSGRGLECDKLSKGAAEAMFNGFIGRLIKSVGPLAGKTFVATHVDSWEVGAQNWTAAFRQEFQRLRGYDPLPFLPVMTGRVVENLEVSERFLWDLRQTVSELLVDNYAGHLSALARSHGMRLTMEAYDLNPCDDLMYAGRVDEPMAEFWTWPPYGVAYSCMEMTSAAHVYGKQIVSAEAFTATDSEKWLGHPYGVKVFGDWAFCHGINRFVLHRYAHQPWTSPQRAPGMAMGPWGLHYERTQTWWEQSKPWHEYLTRCQYLLQQGLFSADICYLSPEESPHRWYVPGRSRERPAYNYDACPPEIVLHRMSVQNGRFVLPDGMSYRLLVLPESKTMTPKLLGRIKTLVEQGGTVIGEKPEKSPSLADYPNCDVELRRLAGELWGSCDGIKVTEHRFGKGRVIWGPSPAEILAADKLPPDFGARCQTRPQGIRYIHKLIGDQDLYFLANKYSQPEDAVCAFRVQGKRPQFLRPDTGSIETPALYDELGGTIRMPIHFDSFGSVFVLFSPDKAPRAERLLALTRNGETLASTDYQLQNPSPTQTNDHVTNTFTMAVWLNPDIEIDLPPEANAGISGLHVMRNDALYPPPGDDIYSEPNQAGAGVSAGLNGACVFEHAANYFSPTLVFSAPLTTWTHVAVVYREGKPNLYLNGKFVHPGIKSGFNVHSGVGVAHRRGVAPFRGSMGTFTQFDRALSDSEILTLVQATPLPQLPPQTPEAQILLNDYGHYRAEFRRAGDYVAKTAAGRKVEFRVPELPGPSPIQGPWTVRFPAGSGAPPQCTFPQLTSWSDHTESGIKYFSGTATYETRFDLSSEFKLPRRRLYLNLGRVAVIAELKLNGHELGALWKPPFEADVTRWLRKGRNVLKIKVTNLWPNRMIGDEQLPEDSKRKSNGTLEEWPDWLLSGQPSPAGRHSFTTWRLWQKDGVLQQSGLLGPVTLISASEVDLPR